MNFPSVDGGVQGNAVFWKNMCASQASHRGCCGHVGEHNLSTEEAAAVEVGEAQDCTGSS